MTIPRICSLSFLIAALALSGGCSSLKSRDDAPVQDSGTAISSTTTDTPATAVAVGAHDSAALSADSLANAEQAARAGLGEGQNVVYFAYDSDAISSAGLNLLGKHAEFIRKNPAVAVRLEGHTDERGTQEYNIALGERRARAVLVFLQSRGVSASQLEIISYGELKPVATGEDEDAFGRNRRVEIVYR